MPLAFPSLSHGTVAFGFFNIESDMLLLDRLFFFADRFCRAVIALVEARADSGPASDLPGWRIDDPAAVGNLHGAIAGVDLSGFIGATYRRFPFPAEPERFKQSPEGVANQALVEEMIGDFGQPETIALRWHVERRQVAVDAYCFDQRDFTALLAYVDRGGYPRWRDEQRPDYVREMMHRLDRLSSPLAPADR